MKRLILAIAAIAVTIGASAQKIEVFSNTPINASSSHEEFKADSAGVIYATSGRIILKKVNFPTYKNSTKATINLTVSSLGDRWDKSGSCFVIPAGSKNNLYEVLRGVEKFPAATAATRNLPGIIIDGDYRPAVELLRFMTPFGVGYFSDDKLGRKPVYIPHWEQQVSWSQDITQLISELQGEHYVGVWIDSWTPEGYQASLSIDFSQSTLPCDPIKKTTVLPVINTVAYGGGQQLPDLFAYQDVEVAVEIPSGIKSATLYYITTGHGGHSGGDEFVRTQNYVYADGQKVIDFLPWRDDCASFRRFNPGSGVWLRKRTAPYIAESGQYESKEIEESLASSDLSRSNWCPGSAVEPESVNLPAFTKAGKHTLRFSIPTAQAADGDKMNHWLVSAYIVLTH